MKRLFIRMGLLCFCAGLVSPMVLAADSATTLAAIGEWTNQVDKNAWSVPIQIVIFMTALTLLPALLLMMTAFTRIIIILSVVRQAIGMPQTPSNQILVGIALFLTLFVMTPTFEKIYDDALAPYMADTMTASVALEKAALPIRFFMEEQVRSNDLRLFYDMAHIEWKESEAIPFRLLIPSFLCSELKTAFEIGFLIFIPFLVIDIVVASVLMSMGMMMLSPLVISLPFKLLIFVLVDGWTITLGSIAASFYSTG
jgi:flagellar biosynthesis protein FliP